MNATPWSTGAPPPPALGGFDHVRRFFDPRLGLWAAKLVPGDCYVTRHDEALLTVLGSCVSVCVRDPRSGLGGMNHFMLPRPPPQEHDRWHGLSGSATRYGTASMEQLIGNLIKQGAERARLEVKMFGGGCVLAGLTDVGRQNIEFAREFMHAEKLVVASEDLGGVWPRQVQYFPRTGRARVRRLERAERDLTTREASYLDALERRPRPGELDLF